MLREGLSGTYLSPVLTTGKSWKWTFVGGRRRSSARSTGATHRASCIGRSHSVLDSRRRATHKSDSDIKPHNFVLTSNAHIRLIDFGSAAPLLPPAADGSQAVPSEYCLVPCGTCDYISPEILQAHEEALVALEMDDDERWAKEHKQPGYGRETDWWSMGAMLYEMAYGVAPFFSREIRHTYAKIIEYHVSLVPVSPSVYRAHGGCREA